MSMKSLALLTGLIVAGLILSAADATAGSEYIVERVIQPGEDSRSDEDSGSSDDQSSKDGDSNSDDKSSDDQSSKDDDSKSDDKSSDDKSSKDDDSKSDDKSSDDKSSKDDDSKSDDKSSDDKSSDDKSSEDDDSSSDDTGVDLPALTAVGTQVTEFNNVTIVPALISASLSAAPTSTVTVSWATEDGTALAGEDYVAASGQLVFAPGQQNATLELAVIGDDFVELTESFFVRFFDPQGAALANGLAEVIILDDDIDEE